MMNQPLSSNDERIVSTNSSPDAAITGPSMNEIDLPRTADSAADSNLMYPLNSYGSLEQTYFYGGYDSSTSSWSGYPQYGPEGLHVVPPQVMYGDNSSLGLHSPYGYNSQMAFGQYSPVAVSTPVPQYMFDSQLFSPQQIPVSPQYYPQSVGSSTPHMSTTIPVSHADMVTPKDFFTGHMSVNGPPNHGFYNTNGVFGSGDHFSSQANTTDGWRSFSSTPGYAHSAGTLGSFDPTVGQRPYSGYGSTPDFVGYYPYEAYQSSTFGGIPNFQSGTTYRNRHNLEKVRGQREQDSVLAASADRNRGPRASKVKAPGTTENGLVPASQSPKENDSLDATAKIGVSGSGILPMSYNSAEFPTEYENAKFFIIKSFSEDNIHRSIKYGVWASTPHGNRKLDAAYQEAKEIGNCPVFLLFSVNASGQFCGVAEMAGAVDFEKNAEYWQQDRWTGQFEVRWHIIKDVPNGKFRHILLENNDSKPVTHSRDSQEVKLEQGIEMLKIFKEYDLQMSILDDFEFYDEREKVVLERKVRQEPKSKADDPEPLTDEMLNLSNRLDEALQLEEPCKDVDATEKSSPQQISKV